MTKNDSFINLLLNIDIIDPLLFNSGIIFSLCKSNHLKYSNEVWNPDVQDNFINTVYKITIRVFNNISSIGIHNLLTITLSM